MRSTMANQWYLLEGVEISELGAKWFLFKFFHKVDVDRVISDAPWTFNSHLLVFHWLREEDGPLAVPLVSSAFWFQVHDLPPRFFLKLVAQQFRNFIGTFLEYDSKNLPKGLKNSLQITDLSLYMQHRRVAMTNNIWLWDEGSELVLGDTLRGR
ncbi:hypothetical protein Gohar_013739 [Gossypium harknessii]|uniref:DUF4283 domain-containing protein n=1 Tax=Gossypium harknessii TaxID=34285 RepID=A0A7J9H119_9ROSI|nr:hypothetical protein [Gossypium harknessii]